MKSYVYVIFRLNGSPCYVGKGRGRRWKSHFRKTHNPHLASIIKQSGELPVVIIREGLTNSQASEIEKSFIKAIGRKSNGGPLVNMTDGGDGQSGNPQSEESSRKKREAMLLPKAREAARSRALGNTHRRGIKVSAKTVEKLRISHLGKKQSQETKDKRAESHRGKKRSPEFCKSNRDRVIAYWAQVKAERAQWQNQ